MEVFKSFQHVLEVLLGRQNGGPDNGKAAGLTDVVILVAIALSVAIINNRDMIMCGVVCH